MSKFLPPVSRRRFLLGTTAALLSPTLPALARDHKTKPLRAVQATASIGPDGYRPTSVWSYNGSVPGPVIRVKQGARVAGRFENTLPQASTVHWHGIRIKNAMDGVPELTQPPVQPGASFDYNFTAPDAGTYWYHPHNRTWEQMARGLYGALIVDEPEPPKVDIDEVLLIDDWRLDKQAQIDDSFGRMMDWSHAGRLGNWVTVNGERLYSRTMAQNERARLRLVNTSNARIFSIAAKGLNGWIVALDGQPLSMIKPLKRLVLGPAQRADVIVDALGSAGSTASLLATTRGGAVPLVQVNVIGRIRDERMPPPDPLPANPVASLGDVTNVRSLTLKMEGGAMGGMRSAMLNGRNLGMRDLVSAGFVWAFNGHAGMPDKPLGTLDLGETAKISITNETSWPHAMHLHGHHFRRVGKRGGLGPLRDTILMDANESADIVFVADNPGDWLLHCHMLEHSAGGMMTWLSVR